MTDTPETVAETPPENPANTVAGNFIASAALIAETKRSSRLTENTLVKLFELNMLWAVNQPQRGGAFTELPDFPEEQETPE